MELSDYVRIIRRSFWGIFGATAVFTLVVVGLIAVAKPKFDTYVTLTIDRPNPIDQSTVSYYLYDDYYSVQASGFFADTIINWLASPSVVQSVYQRASITAPTVRDVNQLGKIFTARKQPPATVSISVKTDDAQTGTNLLSSATKELQARADDLSQKQNDKILLHATDPVGSQIKPFWTLDVAIAIIIGLLGSIFVVLLRHYLRPTR